MSSRDILEMIDEMRDEFETLEEMVNNDELSDESLEVIENALWYYKVYLFEDIKDNYLGEQRTI